MNLPSGQKENAKKTGKTRRPPKKITENYLHNSGLYYLQRFAASSEHFRTVMTRKIDRSCHHHKDQNREDCLTLLDPLIEKFQGLGLLDDESYARGVITSFRRRGLSVRAIQARLKQKGLSLDMINKHLTVIDERTGENSELCAALRHAKRRRLGPFRTRPEEEKTRDREMASLARAGFSYEIVSKAIGMEEDEATVLLSEALYD